MGKRIDLTGQKFGRLTVDAYAETRGNPRNRKAFWLCKCECGNEKVVWSWDLRRGATQSCGCLQKERVKETRTTHGQSSTGTYKTWASMKERCLNLNDNSYKNYGGRGITFCDRWLKFENFLEDMGEEPEGLTIERRNNNKGYSPENCYYATHKQQGRNSRHNHWIEYKGKTQCLKDWAKELKIKMPTLAYRLKKYPPEIAFNM